MKITFVALALFVNSVSFAQTASVDHAPALQAFEKKLNETPDAQILDLRSAEEFALNHLKGAVNIEVQDEDVERQLEGFQKDKPIFVYSIRNGRSSVMANQLKEKGFSQVYELPGGIAAWIGSGKPVEGAKKPGISLAAFDQQVKKDVFVLVEFGTRYCGACKKQSLIIDSLQKENGITTSLIDIYDNQALARDLKITAIPTLILYKDGKVAWQHSGLLAKDELAARLANGKESIAKKSK